MENITNEPTDPAISSTLHRETPEKRKFNVNNVNFFRRSHI